MIGFAVLSILAGVFVVKLGPTLFPKKAPPAPPPENPPPEKPLEPDVDGGVDVSVPDVDTVNPSIALEKARNVNGVDEMYQDDVSGG